MHYSHGAERCRSLPKLGAEHATARKRGTLFLAYRVKSTYEPKESNEGTGPCPKAKKSANMSTDCSRKCVTAERGEMQKTAILEGT